MIQIKARLTTAIDGPAEWLELSPDGQWLAIGLHYSWRIINVLTGEVAHSFSFAHRWVVVAPGGTPMAGAAKSNAISLFGTQATRQHIGVDYDVLDLVFSEHGEQLWVAMDSRAGATRLALFNSRNLERLAQADIPMTVAYPEQPFISSYESIITVDHQSKVVAVTRQSGDTYLGTVFLDIENQRINALPYSISIYDLRPLHSPCFSSSGAYFAALDLPFLQIWTPPDVKKAVTYLLEDEDESIHGLTFLDESPLIAVGNNSVVSEIRLLQITEQGCVDIAQAALPQPLIYSEPYFTMKAETLVGLCQNKILIYRIEQA